jgi:hypothetical protein
MPDLDPLLERHLRRGSPRAGSRRKSRLGVPPGYPEFDMRTEEIEGLDELYPGLRQGDMFTVWLTDPEHYVYSNEAKENVRFPARTWKEEGTIDDAKARLAAARGFSRTAQAGSRSPSAAEEVVSGEGLDPSALPCSPRGECVTVPGRQGNLDDLPDPNEFTMACPPERPSGKDVALEVDDIPTGDEVKFPAPSASFSDLGEYPDIDAVRPSLEDVIANPDAPPLPNMTMKVRTALLGQAR